MAVVDKAWDGSAGRFTDDTQLGTLYTSGMSIRQVAEETGLSTSTVHRRLRASGVACRGRQYADDARALGVKLYCDGLSVAEAAEQAGISRATLDRALNAEGIGRRPRANGDATIAWRGGRWITQAGYVMVYVPKHSPFASMRSNGVYVLEHRLRMAEHLGRPLFQHETVHHRNGDRADNQFGNLELRQGAHGPGRALECAACGCRDLRPIEPWEAASGDR